MNRQSGQGRSGPGSPTEVLRPLNSRPEKTTRVTARLLGCSGSCAHGRKWPRFLGMSAGVK